MKSDYDSNGKGMQNFSCFGDCLAKDSMILLADGTQKRIEAICVGDTIQMTDGTLKIVTDCMQGYEQSLVYFETVSGCHLHLTSGHPVVTERGMIAAGHLNMADRIKIQEEYEHLKYIYLVEYNDTVYNLVFAECSYFYANGIAVGDFMAQMTCSGI